jgi:hypothetical protein
MAYLAIFCGCEAVDFVGKTGTRERLLHHCVYCIHQKIKKTPGFVIASLKEEEKRKLWTITPFDESKNNFHCYSALRYRKAAIPFLEVVNHRSNAFFRIQKRKVSQRFL